MKAYVYIDGIGKKVIWDYFANYHLIVNEVIYIGQRLIYCLEKIEQRCSPQSVMRGVIGTGVWNL